MINVKLTLTIFIVCTFIFLGCSSSSLTIRRTLKAGINLDKSSSIVVGPISGLDGEQFRKELIGRMTTAGFRNVRQDLKVDEMLQRPLDTNLVKDIAKASRASILLSGIFDLQIKESKYQATKDQKLIVMDQKSGLATFGYYIVDISTGKYLLAGDLRKTGYKEEEEGFSSLSSLIFGGGDMKTDLRRELGEKFMKDLTPHEEQMDVVLFLDPDIPELETGVDFAKMGQWDKALETFRISIDKYLNNPNIHKAYYDLGVAYEYQQRYDEARTNLKKAYEMKNESDYMHEIDACWRFQQDYKRRTEQSTK
jgi:tetratricopeptide (TPR) repeat protein